MRLNLNNRKSNMMLNYKRTSKDKTYHLKTIQTGDQLYVYELACYDQEADCQNQRNICQEIYGKYIQCEESSECKPATEYEKILKDAKEKVPKKTKFCFIKERTTITVNYLKLREYTYKPNSFIREEYSCYKTEEACMNELTNCQFKMNEHENDFCATAMEKCINVKDIEHLVVLKKSLKEQEDFKKYPYCVFKTYIIGEMDRIKKMVVEKEKYENEIAPKEIAPKDWEIFQAVEKVDKMDLVMNEYVNDYGNKKDFYFEENIYCYDDKNKCKENLEKCKKRTPKDRFNDCKSYYSCSKKRNNYFLEKIKKTDKNVDSVFNYCYIQTRFCTEMDDVSSMSSIDSVIRWKS